MAPFRGILNTLQYFPPVFSPYDILPRAPRILSVALLRVQTGQAEKYAWPQRESNLRPFTGGLKVRFQPWAGDFFSQPGAGIDSK